MVLLALNPHTMTTSNDPIRPLNITIVGAGIAGLTAAVALRKNGHLVQIFETSEIKTEIGACTGCTAKLIEGSQPSWRSPRELERSAIPRGI
ncbi:hypothetical protein B0H16DRAFT_1491713, partial [Mycena metata]